MAESPASAGHGATGADSVQVKMLQMRIDHLEEMRHSKRRYHGDCCPCATIVFGLVSLALRCIPLFTLLGFMLTVYGVYLILGSETAIHELSTGLGYGEHSGGIVRKVYMVASFTATIAALCFAAALPSTGPLREYVFGRKGRGCTYFFQTIAGPGFLALLAVVVFAKFVCYLLVSVVAVPNLTVLLVTWGACQSGSGEAQTGLSQALAELARSKFGEVGAEWQNSVEAVCKDEQNAVLSAATSLVLGLLLVCLGQAWLACCTASNLAKVQMTGPSRTDSTK